MKASHMAAWLPLEAMVSKDLFKAEVRAWAQRIGVRPRELHIRPMKRKWGSCSTAGRVTFNSDLLVEPADIRREVIVEELLHLKVPNHGRLFRALKRAYLAEAGEGLRPGSRPVGRFRVPFVGSA
jgi:predicted metal-dependent hydrolase